MTTSEDDLVRALANGLKKSPFAPKLSIEDCRQIAKDQVTHLKRAGYQFEHGPPASGAAHLARG